MLRSAPLGNDSKIAKHIAPKQERLLLMSRWSGCKFCQGLGPLCMNSKEENKKRNLLILRAPSSQKTEEIWLENCTKNVVMLQICMFAQMKIVEVEFINIWRLNILWWPEIEDSLSSGEVPAAAKAIPPPIEWPICWIFFIIIILVLWLIWYKVNRCLTRYSPPTGHQMRRQSLSQNDQKCQFWAKFGRSWAKNPKFYWRN